MRRRFRSRHSDIHAGPKTAHPLGQLTMQVPSKESQTLPKGVPDLQGNAPKGETMMAPLRPAPAKAKAQVFTRRA
jgi:hypothetical protein